MLTELLFVPIVLVYLGILCALFVYGMNFIYLTFVALRTGDQQPAATIPETWPMVTVQLPVYNEYYVAGRLIDAAARIDYPADRLEIQVLDDSTDDTSTIVADLVAKWRDKGVDITHVQREGREGYKAGALRHGLEIARGELIAIFDADFVPTPDFLRAAVPAMVADPGLAFVQARWGHVNRDFSLLTPSAGRRHRRALRHRASRPLGTRLLLQLQRHGRDLAAERTPRRRGVAGRHADRGPRRVVPRVHGGMARGLPPQGRGSRGAPREHERVPEAAAPLGTRQLRVRDQAPPTVVAIRPPVVAEGVGDAAPHRLLHPPACCWCCRSCTP